MRDKLSNNLVPYILNFAISEFAIRGFDFLCTVMRTFIPKYTLKFNN